ncbi:ABC transporter substrate-binding protein [Micromonospora sp. NBC_01813]|uniref:ABC transporter substrate-binding protein n=1 Tax=Micromonospora sp. NBC_01813 TaxID=2975988 RepID=UPI002DD9863E|nr:ABC transporter substrate-binding protein [Micromonospora sp. NBC_01813]WSA10134.1 ABC transporter substrate-binding protein [Micromonospora sp. NBC_01813]
MRVSAPRYWLTWRTVTAAAAAAVVVLSAGCGNPESPQVTAPADPAEVSNCGVDVEVDVAEPPSRVVTMNQPATEIMLALGLADRLIGTAYLDDDILPEYAAAYESVPVIADEYPSKEILLAAEPDFVYASFGSAFGDEAAGDRAALGELGVGSYLSPAGCPADVRPSPLTIEHVFGEIRDIATIFGVVDRADALIDDQRSRIEAAVAGAGDVSGVSVLWWDGGTDAPSLGACCGAPNMVMSAVGVSNAFEDLTGSWGETNWETVIERDPGVIVLIDAAWSPAAEKRSYVESSVALRDVPAVADGRFVVIPFSATAAGVRNVAAIELLATGVAALAVSS